MDSSFNPSLNIVRSITGTWQSFQGLGLLGGHGYASQLPHALFIWVLDIFLPSEVLRYVFAFTMLLSGVLGSFELNRFVLQKQKWFLFFSELTINATASIGALVYLLHYTTVQTFYVHLEPFIAMYGLLPWALLVLFVFLRQTDSSKKIHRTLGLLLLLNFFLSVIGFIPPVFISYVMFVSILLGYFVITQIFNSRRNLIQRLSLVSKKSLLVVGILIVTNFYWLSSVGIFTFFQPKDYLQAKLNQTSTQEFVLMNQTFGKLENVALGTSFYDQTLDQTRFEKSSDASNNNATQPILLPWKNHFESIFVKIIGYSLFLFAILGWLTASITFFAEKNKQNSYESISLATMGIFSLSLVATGVPVLSFLHTLITTVPTMEQAFRIPFSKISMSLSLFYSFGISFFALFLFHKLSVFLGKTSNHSLVNGGSARNVSLIFKRYLFAFVLICFVALSYYSFPIIRGHFLYEGSRVSMPEAYGAAQDFFLKKTDKNDRVLVLPLLNYYGWDMHTWGYTGSGFWWYGIPNPIVHRSFDVWNPQNESLYLELQYAVNTRNRELFVQLLTKYNIRYIIFDTSLFAPGNESAVIQTQNQQSIIAAMDLEPVFASDPLTIYKVTNTVGGEKIVCLQLSHQILYRISHLV